MHLNATYLLIGDEKDILIIKDDENSGVKWFDINDVLNYVSEERIKTVYTKLFNEVKKIKIEMLK